MLKIKIYNFDIDLIMNSGQFFRYIFEEDNSYTIILDRVINVKQVNNYLYVDSNNKDNLKEIVYCFFDLNTDYDEINKYLLNIDNNLKDIIEFNKNYRILNMNPFETIISYIISQRNSVNNIKKIVNLISEKYGEKVTYKNKDYYLFPTIDRLKKLKLEDLKEFKLGYRDKYIYNIINSDININSIYNLSGEEGLKYLMNYDGIGIKVASCILLFSYKKYDVFPVDTWVKKGIESLYNLDNINNIILLGKDKYKDYSGVLFQYVFNYYRNKNFTLYKN